MTRPPTIVIVGALLALSGCMSAAPPVSSPSRIPEGTSPRAAVLGREPTASDCFATSFHLVQVPDGPTLQRHVQTATRRPAWLPSHGFLGSPTELARAVEGQLIATDPQTTWILVADDLGPRADRYFPLLARSGERVWYRDGSVHACA